jgi:small redox-active disulfide protein 2
MKREWRRILAQDDITQIRVDKYSVGIVGLRDAMKEIAAEFSSRSDDEAGEELLKRLRKRNYIPDAAMENYKKAFIREFRRFLGEAVAEDPLRGLEIKVLGPGCVQCDRLEQELMAVMAEAGIAADVEHVRDIKEIGKYGVMGTPALIINGRVKSVGKVPGRSKLREWLSQAQAEKAI